VPPLAALRGRLNTPAVIVVTVAVVALAHQIWYLVVESRAVGSLGFPLDDGWIHLQFARNLARDGQLAFNRFEPSSGSTSPLWTLLLAAPLALHVEPVAAAKGLGMMLAAACAGLGATLAGELTRHRGAAWCAGLAIACSARMTWSGVSGMEGPLYVALTLATLLVYLRDPDAGARWWGLLGALSGTARPETFLLLPLLVIHRAVVAWRSGRWIEARRPLIQATTVAAGVALVYAIVNLSGGPYPWPSTFGAKEEGRGLLSAIGAGDARAIVRSALDGLGAVNLFVRFFFDQSALLAMLLLPGAMAVAAGLGQHHPRGVVVLWAALLGPLTIGMMAPALPVTLQQGRYVAHALALGFVIASAGLAGLWRVGGRRGGLMLTAVAALAIARLASQDIAFATRHAQMVGNIESLHGQVAHWIRMRTRPDALIAANDIGALAWFSERRVLDLEGLVTPDIVPHKAARTHLTFLEQQKPDYLVIFPQWYPHLAARTDLFREVHRVSSPRVSAAHDTTVVYSTPWLDSQAREPAASDEQR
jgi:arabinofuranosyltransferase